MGVGVEVGEGVAMGGEIALGDCFLLGLGRRRLRELERVLLSACAGILQVLILAIRNLI